MAAISVPGGAAVTRVILPADRQMHLFAATLATLGSPEPTVGLSVLNTGKYGSGTMGSVFRLSLLRSSNDPDPNPDEGLQSFTYGLLPHAGDCRSAGVEQAGLALNIPLYGVLTTQHAARSHRTGVRE